MRVYGNKSGFIHRTPQPPPERFCPTCGKSLGAMWKMPEPCLRCRAKVERMALDAKLLSIGKKRCPKCGKLRKRTDFVNNKGVARATCSRCREKAKRR